MDVLTIAISGCSCAGKTTFVALLKNLLPSETAIFLHADMFGVPLSQMPIFEGFRDCDSRSSYRFEDIRAAIDYAKVHRRYPPQYQASEALDGDIAKYKSNILPGFLDEVKANMQCIRWEKYKAIVVVDGLLLLHDESLRARFDVMLLLRASRAEAWRRRSLRYNGAEHEREFWQTETYFKSCVWRNYEKEHCFLFPDGNVEAELISSSASSNEFHVAVQPSTCTAVLEDVQRWAIGTLVQECKGLQ